MRGVDLPGRGSRRTSPSRRRAASHPSLARSTPARPPRTGAGASGPRRLARAHPHPLGSIRTPPLQIVASGPLRGSTMWPASPATSCCPATEPAEATPDVLRQGRGTVGPGGDSPRHAARCGVGPSHPSPRAHASRRPGTGGGTPTPGQGPALRLQGPGTDPASAHATPGPHAGCPRRPSPAGKAGETGGPPGGHAGPTQPAAPAVREPARAGHGAPCGGAASRRRERAGPPAPTRLSAARA